MATVTGRLPAAGSRVVVSRTREHAAEEPRVQSLGIDDPPLALATNRILASLPPAEANLLPPQLERITFDADNVIFSPEATAHYVYFPQEAVVSLLTTTEDGRAVEVGLTGSEGVLGIHEMLGGRCYWCSAVVEIGGSCLRMEMEPLRAVFLRGGVLQARLLRYMRYVLIQASQISVCNRHHRVRERLARRLLMIHDHVRKSKFPMTHEALSYALGTPRSEVSFAAESLRFRGIIDYARGNIAIVSRAKLESASCECYKLIHREFLGLDRASGTQ